MGVITHSSPLGMSAHFKPERDIVLFDMNIVVGRDKLYSRPPPEGLGFSLPNFESSPSP